MGVDNMDVGLQQWKLVGWVICLINLNAASDDIVRLKVEWMPNDVVV